MDVLFTSAFKGMKLKESKLTPVPTATYRVEQKELSVLGFIELPVMFTGMSPDGDTSFTMLMVKCLVIEVLSAYNAIIGRSTQTSIRMHTDIKYLTL